MIQTMPGNSQPLDQKFTIVDPDGRPTLYFIKWAQQRQIDISEGITPAQALSIIEQYLADHTLQEGSGISISPSGNISDSPTIAAEVQAILDQITTTQGSVLFRGATDWAALAPGTSGQFLKTNGAGADPEWATAGGGGGGSWSVATTWDFAVDGATASIITDVTGFSDFLITGHNVTMSASGFRVFQVSTDGGSTYINSGYVALGATGVANATDTSGFMHSTAATAARSFMAFLKAHNTTGIKFYETVRDTTVAFLGTPTTPAITHVNVFPTTGNFNGGTIKVLVR